MKKNKEPERDYREVLMAAYRLIQKAGCGSHHLTTALRMGTVDRATAIAAVKLARADAEKWADYSTPDAARHYSDLFAILDGAMLEIMGDGW